MTGCNSIASIRVMNLQTYLEKHGLSQEQFAKQIGVTQGAVWQWLNGETRITAERAVEIERATKSEVSRHDLRPDLFPKAHAA